VIAKRKGLAVRRGLKPIKLEAGNWVEGWLMK
jgi:hypothetical protein